MIRKTVEIIKKLLAVNEHAILPEFGGFVVQHQSAIITNQGIIPPQSSISFNSLLKHNDGMFIIELSRTEKISYKEAAKRTRTFVEKIKFKLQKEQFIDLGDIGKFQKLENGQIEFTPNTIAEFLPTNFGYKKVLLPKKNERSKSIKLSASPQKLMRYAAVLLIFVSLFFTTGLNKTSLTIQADFSKLLKFDLPEVTVFPQDEKTLKEKMTEEKMTEEKTYQSVAQTTSRSQIEYKLVVATFQTQEKATSYKEELKTNQYPDADIVISSTNTKVVIKSFNSIVAAVNYMEKIKHLDTRFADAWVMKTKRSHN